MFLDQCLSYDEHIRKTVTSCMNKLIQINRIKHLLDKEIHFYQSLIALFLAGYFIPSQFGTIPRQLTSRSFSFFKIVQPGLSWDSANMTISLRVLDHFDG